MNYFDNPNNGSNGNSANNTVNMPLSDKFGFFDIFPTPEGFTVCNPSAEFCTMIGRDPCGINYLDLVAPESRDDVAAMLSRIQNTDNDFEKQPRVSGSIRHKILLADGSEGAVVLNVGRTYLPQLLCSVVRMFDEFMGEWVSVYRSNVVLESFAVSLAVLALTSNGHFMVQYANDGFYEMIGWNRYEFKEFFNECVDDRIFIDDFPSFSSNLRSLSRDVSECVFESRTVMAGGGIRFNEVRARYLTEEDGKPMISVVFVDITERKKLRRELIVKNERFSIIQENTDQVLFDYDTEQDICFFSGNLGRLEQSLSLYGIECVNNEFVVEHFFASRFALGMMGSEDYTALSDTIATAIIKGESGEGEWYLCLLGQPAGFWCRAIFSVVKDDNGDVVRIVGRIKNVDKQKRTEAMMEKRIKTDMLTGLLNQDTAFQQISGFLNCQADGSRESEKYHALMIIDIDHFRTINEFFGHTFGDDVIREFASDIKSSFRDTDIIGRIGGDEFIVLMKNVTVKFAAKKAGRLCRSLIKHYGIQNRVTLTCSIGMAFFGKDTDDFDCLYQYADWAMVNAKKNGRCAYSMYDSEAHDDYLRMEEMNNRSRMDPPAGSTEIVDLDTNLLDIAFSLATASEDIYGTLEILLRTVGRKYNLSAVSVLAKQYDAPDHLMTVERWQSNRNLRPGHRSPMNTGSISLDTIFKGASLRCVSDISVCNLPPALKSRLKNDGIYAFVLGKLEGLSGEHFGYLMFTQFNRTRKWSRREINTFKYLAKIISVRLVKEYNDRNLRFKEDDLQTE